MLTVEHYTYIWCSVQGSNLWPPACKAGALPAELTEHTDRFKASAMPPTLRCWGASSFTPKPAKVMLPNTWFPFPIRFTVSALFVGRAWLRGQDSNLRFSAHGADEIAASLPRNISLVVQKTLFAKTHFTL